MKILLTGLLGLALLGNAPTRAFASDRWGDRRDDRRDDRHDDWHDDRDRDRFDRPVVSFEVIRTRLVTRACDRCEYRRDEYGAPGVFRVETRLYTEILRGRVVRTWRETDEVFDHCARPLIRIPWE